MWTSVGRSPIWMGLDSGQWKRCNYRLTHMCECTTVFISRISLTAHSSPPHSLWTRSICSLKVLLMMTCVWVRIAGFHINSTCWQQHTHTRVRCIVFMLVNWCRTNYIGSIQGKFEQCRNYSMLHFVLCHRKPLCRHLDKRGNENVRRGEETNGLQWSSRSEGSCHWDMEVMYPRIG